MSLRRVEPNDHQRILEYLDERTLVLRWLVAFFRHAEELPEESSPYWSLWCDGPPKLSRVAAHSFHMGTTYVCADDGAGLRELEPLIEEELLSERIIGDREVVEAWRASSPAFFERSASVVTLSVLVFPSSGSAESSGPGRPTGFRHATEADRATLEQYERQQSVESGMEVESDFESLIDRGLVFIVEAEGRVQGSIRSNLSDGRYVHGGGLYVHPRDRGRGVGRALALGLGREVAASGEGTLLLDCDQANAPAIGAYRAAGFREIGEGLEIRFPETAWK